MYRAVIVDDEPFMLEGMRLMIDWKRCGFTLCGEACSAQDALHLVDTLQPHLLITDVRMPGMLGTDLASIICRYHPNILVLFFSGYRDFSYAQSAIRSHAFGYLVKPIDTEEVENTLLRAKAELDERQAEAPYTRMQTSFLRDQVFSRIACGSTSPEALLRASVLMELKPDDPCYCAVLAHPRGAVSESTKIILASFHAVLFELSPKEYGLMFRQVEHDFPLLQRIARLTDPHALTLSIGGLYNGVQGFQKSLLEALEAQGMQYTLHGTLRVYRPFDAHTIAWLDRVHLPALLAALTGASTEALETQIASLTEAMQEFHPDRFALRCMAAMLDAMLPVAHDSSLRDLSEDGQAVQPEAWLDTFCNQLRAIHQAIAPDNTAIPDPVQATLSAIRNRYSEPLNLGHIANELHINPAYLGQLVRKHTGATFHRHLLMTRIEHACLLLRQTTNSIGEIGLCVGFRDADYFSQQFRNRMGMSPVAYRNAIVSGGDIHAAHQ